MKGTDIKIYRCFVILSIFGIAMGFLEAIVVVYLRQIYYPHGFCFPLSPIPLKMLSVECLREITTIIMLAAVAFITGRNFLQKFSYFLYTFAIWDLFYYAGLKLLLNWPQSFLTWDILFLIPVVWIAPVLAPVICSLTMILLAGCVVFLQEKGYIVKLKLYEWGLILLGVFIIFFTFIWDYSQIIIQGGFLSSFLTLANNEHFQQIILRYEPTEYNWYLFALGEFFVLCALLSMLRRTKYFFSPR